VETVRDAATVMIVRDNPDLEVFVLLRNAALEFAPGATVFPGGAVDPADVEHAGTIGCDEFRVAAARECLEEAGIPLDPLLLIEVARWITPPGGPRRYDTRFFVARAPDGHDGEHDGSELVASAWVKPIDALRAFARGEINLILPTQRSLEMLAAFDRVDDLFACLQEPLQEPTCPT
jgi:8-oxo-dGTP pyrophosphatase MutT (NUDIX family)